VGAKEIPNDALSAALTQPPNAKRVTRTPFEVALDVEHGKADLGALRADDESSEPAWKIGGSAKLDPISRKTLERAIRRALAELGFFRTRFTTDLGAAGDVVD